MPPRASKRKAKGKQLCLFHTAFTLHRILISVTATATEDDDAWRSSGGLPRKRVRLSASHVDEDAEEPSHDSRKSR